MSAPVLHVKGQVFVSADDIRPEVWVVGGRFTFTPPTSGDVQTVQGYALPGFVDAHCHVGMGPGGAIEAEEAIAQATTDRDAGTLLIRDAGSALDTRFLQERDDMPEIIRAGRHIARTKRYIRNYGHEIEPEDLVEYVRHEARRGDGWVKLVGDWIHRDVGDLAPCWPVEALTAAIAAAHEEGARVTAHCFGEQSLADFAEAGTDCIEHATGLTEETVEVFAAKGIAIVPTLVNILTFPNIAEAGEAKFPGYAAHMRDLYERRYNTIGAAHDAGVPIFVGTDAGGVIPHGLVAEEMAELTKAGMTTVEAISAATWRAREWLRRPGIEEGAPADLVVASGNPFDDLSLLATPSNIVLNGLVVA
ncbi:MAG: amidohydrolase family protein [Dermatophilus congolensis]|nr:amidohydrolase family protein [Dermatophilus congolensis]